MFPSGSKQHPSVSLSSSDVKFFDENDTYSPSSDVADVEVASCDNADNNNEGDKSDGDDEEHDFDDEDNEELEDNDERDFENGVEDSVIKYNKYAKTTRMDKTKQVYTVEDTLTKMNYDRDDHSGHGDQKRRKGAADIEAEDNDEDIDDIDVKDIFLNIRQRSHESVQASTKDTSVAIQENAVFGENSETENDIVFVDFESEVAEASKRFNSIFDSECRDFVAPISSSSGTAIAFWFDILSTLYYFPENY
jgi:hypothetical protein